MPGERTPDQSPSSRQGSTDDEISLREHMQRQIDAQWRYAERLHSDQGAYFERVFAELRVQLDERYATQTKALDAAFASAEKAVQAALAAAETAVAKAETASDKRFESVNEFRAQLADQSRTFITRDESLSRHDRNAEALMELAKRHEQDISQINSRLDLGQGRTAGLDKGWAMLVGVVAVGAAVIGVILAVTQ